MPQRIDYKVEGLDCPDEAAALRRALAGRGGVLDLDFDLLGGRMTVLYDPARIAPGAIAAAVAATGMRAIPWVAAPAAPSPPQDRPPAGLWVRHGRAAMAAASAALLTAGFVSHWLACGSFLDALTGARHAGVPYPLAAVCLYFGSAAAGAWFVIPKAVRAAARLAPDMNLLMVLAMIGAMALGEWFEAASVAVLFALALLLEHWSVGRARRAIEALLDLTPATARCRDEQTGQIVERPVEHVPVGTCVILRPGEKVPLDGAVIEGRSSVDQAPVTGESMPVPKAIGDEVFAGTINREGALVIRTSRPAADTTLARIIHLVHEAQSRRAPAQQWVERFARYYTPAMIALAAATAAVPPLVLGGGWSGWLYRGLVVLVIACPCALVISTPVTIVSALASAARNGVLIKGGAYLEAAGRLGAIALDKTGTLTHGRPEVQRVVPLDDHTADEVLALAAAMEAHSEHPLARAILRKAEAAGLGVPPAAEFRALPGRGAEAAIDGRTFWIGSHRLLHEKGQETPEVHRRAEELEDAGHTVVAVGDDQGIRGLISIADELRPQAASAVRQLQRLGVEHVVMLTGDNDGTASAVARAVGVDDCRSELLPEDKVAAVQALSRLFGRVAMVGDGINDAPAMAAAAVGVAMGAIGADAAIETADVALMSDDLSKLPWLIRHSRRAVRIIRQNVAFALGLKVLFLALAFAGLASLWAAIAADMGASLLVILNALRLLRAESSQ